MDLTDPANQSKAEHYRSRCLRYLWMKSARPISANDTGFAEPVTPIMELISGCSFVAQGTDELQAILGVRDDKLEALLRAIARGEKIVAVRRKRS